MCGLFCQRKGSAPPPRRLPKTSRVARAWHQTRCDRVRCAYRPRCRLDGLLTKCLYRCWQIGAGFSILPQWHRLPCMAVDACCNHHLSVRSVLFCDGTRISGCHWWYTPNHGWAVRGCYQCDWCAADYCRQAAYGSFGSGSRRIGIGRSTCQSTHSRCNLVWHMIQCPGHTPRPH